MVLNPTPLPNSNKVKKLGDLASELGSDVDQIRDNEGEAANHGIYYDDSEYDYMQHMRDLGAGSGEVHFIEASATKNKGKASMRPSLEDALKEATLEDRAGALLDEDILPSKNLHRATYQAQQDVPDALAGFQPDMDPRLREVLEALEDDAYVDDDDEVFEKLAEDGEEVEEDEFDQAAWEDEEGWESDDTAKPNKEYRTDPAPTMSFADDDRDDHGDGDWMANFSKFKKDEKAKLRPLAPSQSDLQSSMLTTTTNGGRRKKRKGALTNPSAYSMTSSSMCRTEGLTDLDARFEKLEERYNEDGDNMDDMASVSAASSAASSVQGPVRGDFDSIMDDFLGSYSRSGKKHVKKGKYQTGMEQLDEVRKGLGPARIRSQKA